MTCIAGLVHKGTVYIGGDGCSSNSWTASAPQESKVFVTGDAIIGFTGAWRFGQILQSVMSVPIPRKGQATISYMRTDFVNAVRSAMKGAGALKIKDGIETGGTALIGYEGRLFLLQCDFSVLDQTEGGFAVGSGEEPARGSLHTSAHIKGATPKKRILMALEAASEISIGVTPPFAVLSL